jgi:triacylglycerol lipase
MTLSPALAAQIASAVYGIRTVANVERGIARTDDAGLLGNGTFDFGNAKSVGGTSGAGIRSASGFSMVLPCKGAMQGEFVVATRGTVTVADWITDITAAMEPGPSGTSVHAGFNRVAKSVLREINSQLVNKNPTMIHVVGHSLGGAVANILAASFALQGIGVELYTFGSPRPGLSSFRDLLADKIGERNMYRAFSMSDPVPLVPIHPFLHAPGIYPGALVGSTHGLVNPFAHKMGAYKSAVGKVSWDNLRNAARVTPMNIEELFAMAASQIKMPGASGGLYLLGRILKKMLSASNVAIGSQVTGAVTVLDQIGLTLTRAQSSNSEINDQLKGFMKYALILAGLPFKITTMVTAAYLTHVLSILLRAAVGQANIAITRPDQDA